MIRQQLLDYCQGLKDALDTIPTDAAEKFLQLLESAYQEGRQVFIMGNGGSGSTASHAAGDLNKGVSYGREKRFRVMSLNDSMATVTAYANDVSYSQAYVEQLKNFLNRGDLVIGISGSGNSPSILKAIEYANQQGAVTVGLCGFSGGKLAAMAQFPVHVPVNDMQKVEDIHMMLFHVAMQVLCARMDAPAQAPAGRAC
jgi:D-sedoheptulose 7-phosphate isomerase